MNILYTCACSILTAKKYGLEDIPPDVANLISHATQERLRNLLEKLSVTSEHRLEIYKVTLACFCVVQAPIMDMFHRLYTCANIHV